MYLGRILCVVGNLQKTKFDRVSKELEAAKVERESMVSHVISLQDKVAELQVSTRNSQLQVCLLIHSSVF